MNDNNHHVFNGCSAINRFTKPANQCIQDACIDSYEFY